MVKRMKFDETGDSDDLQALFDSIATPSAKPRFEVVAPDNLGGDNDELQDLFDSVAQEFGDHNAPEPTFGEASRAQVEPPVDTGNSGDMVFTRLGQMTRQLHDSLRALGYDEPLKEVAGALPDARQRLSYIAQMTEQAASRVLNATDIVQPIQDRLHRKADALHDQWGKVFSNQLSVEEFKSLAASTRDFLGDVRDGSRNTNSQLMEIVMAQDFQDLTGQVIKKVVDMAQKLEAELLTVLIQAMPPEKRMEKLSEKHSGLMNGPVINSEGREDVVTSQEQVDDLLESLGF